MLNIASVNPWIWNFEVPAKISNIAWWVRRHLTTFLHLEFEDVTSPLDNDDDGSRQRWRRLSVNNPPLLSSFSACSLPFLQSWTTLDLSACLLLSPATLTHSLCLLIPFWRQRRIPLHPLTIRDFLSLIVDDPLFPLSPLFSLEPGFWTQQEATVLFWGPKAEVSFTVFETWR